jgi:hypothetical protein
VAPLRRRCRPLTECANAEASASARVAITGASGGEGTALVWLAALRGATVAPSRARRGGTPWRRPQVFADLLALVNAGRVRPPVAATFPLDVIAGSSSGDVRPQGTRRGDRDHHRLIDNEAELVQTLGARTPPAQVGWQRTALGGRRQEPDARDPPE